MEWLGERFRLGLADDRAAPGHRRPVDRADRRRPVPLSRLRLARGARQDHPEERRPWHRLAVPGRRHRARLDRRRREHRGRRDGHRHRRARRAVLALGVRRARHVHRSSRRSSSRCTTASRTPAASCAAARCIRFAASTSPWLGTIFAALVSLAAFGIGNMVQANSVSESLRATFGVAPWMTGLVLAVVTAFVIIGGIRRIGEVTEYLVPAMALFYLGGGLIILIRYASEIPDGSRSGVRRRVHGHGGDGRIRRLDAHHGAALRCRARPVLQRSRTRQRADGACGGADGSSRASGPLRHLRSVRRHDPRLHDDGPRHPRDRFLAQRRDRRGARGATPSPPVCPAPGATSS